MLWVGRRKGLDGSNSRPNNYAGSFLPDMDRVSKSLSNERACKPLKGLVGDDRVSDIIYKISGLIDQLGDGWKQLGGDG